MLQSAPSELQLTVQRLDHSMLHIAEVLQHVVDNVDNQWLSRLLDGLGQKISAGELDICQRLKSGLCVDDASWERKLGVALNQTYLQALEAQVQQGGKFAAEKAVTLLRSPGNFL